MDGRKTDEENNGMSRAWKRGVLGNLCKERKGGERREQIMGLLQERKVVRERGKLRVCTCGSLNT